MYFTMLLVCVELASTEKQTYINCRYLRYAYNIFYPDFHWPELAHLFGSSDSDSNIGTVDKIKP